MGVELILEALAAGATAGLTNTTSSTVQDTYDGLKSLLGRRLKGRKRAVDALEAKDPGELRERLAKDLVASGAAEDDEILATAQRLLGLVPAEVVQAGTSNVVVHTNYGAAGTFHDSVTINNGPPVPPAAPGAR